MNDVVIVYPSTGFDRKHISITLPLAVLSVASGLIGDFNVKIIDQRVVDDWEELLEKELCFGPICVGLSSMTGTQIYYALQVTRFVKQHNPEIPVVWGGMHASLMAEQTLEHPDIDFVIMGDGEDAFRDLVIELSGNRCFEKVQGLGWKDKNGTIHINPRGAPSDINNLPPLPYHLLNIEDYTTPSQYLYPGVKRLLPFQGSRGCPYKCMFCSEPALTRGYRMMKPELFYEQTMELVRKYNLDHITFYDEEFFADSRWATEIARLINGQYTWWSQSRADNLLKVDLKEMERCGMLVIAPGLESGSNRILDWIGKGEKTAQFVEVNRRLSRTSIIPQYNLIIGFPTETDEELNQTIDLTLRLMEDNPRAVVNSFSPFTPLPGTKLLDISIREHGFKQPERLEGWMGIARRRLPTPWLQKKLETYQHLMYTSVFINNAKRFVQVYWWAPPFMFDLYSRLIKYRWRKHEFRNSLDIKLARIVHRIYSPADFIDVPRKR